MTTDPLHRHRAFYAVQLASNAALLPLLGARFAAMGVDSIALGSLLSALPAGRLLSAPLWAWVADRWRLGGALLRVSAMGSAIAGLCVQRLESLTAIGIAMFAFAATRAPSSAVLDGFILSDLEASGRPAADYGRIRLWGSVGFLLGIAAATALYESPSAQMLTDLTLIGTAALSFGYPWRGGGTPAPIGPAIRALIHEPFFWPLMCTGLLQGWSVSTYDSFFSVHVESMGLPATVLGGAVFLGVTAEIALMARAREILRAWGPSRTLLVATAVSVPRWLLTAMLTDPSALVAVQVLHGLSFGAFWIAGVERLARAASPAIAASAQALWAAVTYGLGAWIGAEVAGAAHSHLGTPGIFLILTGIACGATACAAWLTRVDQR